MWGFPDHGDGGGQIEADKAGECDLWKIAGGDGGLWPHFHDCGDSGRRALDLWWRTQRPVGTW